uniref:Glutamine amidotransferase domain-containing protein n=1 Tax=Leersia perrieri TaxID=77586 RepID=A0A0D9XDW2_9ORYZ
MKIVAAEGGRRKKYALLLAARDSEYVRKVYGGYLEVFVRAFGDSDGDGDGGEDWDVFRVVDGEFPGDEELDGYDGFVISGSPHDAYSDELWILRLCLLVCDLVAMRKRLLGICFGHQVICRALGGHVGKARGGWDIGIREVAISETLPPYMYLNGVLQRRLSAATCYAKITEIHQDEVWELPAGAEVLASSSKTGVEMFCFGDRVLGIQGHPEYTSDILLNLVYRLSTAGSITVSMAMAEGVRRQLETTGPDREFWIELCKSFLKTEEE